MVITVWLTINLPVSCPISRSSITYWFLCRTWKIEVWCDSSVIMVWATINLLPKRFLYVFWFLRWHGTWVNQMSSYLSVWAKCYYGVNHYQFAHLKRAFQNFSCVMIPVWTLKIWSMVWLNGYHGVSHYQFANLKREFQNFYCVVIPVLILKNWSMVWLKCCHGVSHYQFAFRNFFYVF